MDKKDSISIETQIDYCKREAGVPDEQITVFQDKGFSGKNTNRPGFTQMMQGIQNGTFEKIIVYRLDRISRSITDFAGIMDVLEEHGTDFVSTTEKFDTSTPMGRAMLYIVMVFAQLERETIAERIRDNYYSRGKLGVWLGGPAPFGFETSRQKQNGKNVSVLRPTRDLELVKRIFSTYADTENSLGTIARDLKAEFEDRYGVWNNVKLSRILHNPIYAEANADIYHYFKNKGCIMTDLIEDYDGTHGIALYGKRDRNLNKYRNLDEHVASLSLTKGVIDAETFLRCQYKLDRNMQIKNSGKGKHSWLTGLVKCGYCGYSMVTRIYNDTRYLYCSGRSNNECDTELKTQHLNDIEAYVDQEVQKFIKNVKQEQLTATRTVADAETNKLKIELYKIEEQISNLLEGLANAQGITMNYINKKISELDNQKSEIQKQLEQHYTQEYKIHIPTEQEWNAADLDEKRNISHRIIERVEIYNDRIQIRWKP